MPDIDTMTRQQCANLLTAECYYYDKGTRSFKEYGLFANVVLLRNHLQNITVFFRKIAWTIFTGEARITNADIAGRLATLLETTVDEAEVAKLKLLAKHAMLCVGDKIPQGQELQQAILAAAAADIQPKTERKTKTSQSDVSAEQLQRMLIKTTSTFGATLRIHLQRFGFFLATGSIITNKVLADSILNKTKARNVDLELEEIEAIFTLTEELQSNLHNAQSIYQALAQTIVKKINPTREGFFEPEIIAINKLAQAILPHISDEKIANQLSDIENEWIELQDPISDLNEVEEDFEDEANDFEELKDFTPLRSKIQKQEPKKSKVEEVRIETIEEFIPTTKVPEPPKFEIKVEKKKAPPLPQKKNQDVMKGQVFPNEKKIPSAIKNHLKGLRAVVDSDNETDGTQTPTPVKRNPSKHLNVPSSVVKVLYYQEEHTTSKKQEPVAKKLDVNALGKGLKDIKLKKIERKNKTPQKQPQSLLDSVHENMKFFIHSPGKQEAVNEDDSW